MRATKITALLLSAGLVLCLAACGAADSGPGQSGPAPTRAAAPAESGRAVVAYFSATGNTRAVAERIASLTGAELCEIVPAEPYTESDLDYRDSGSRSSLEMADPGARPEIASELPELESGDMLYLGYPIWHGQAPRILSTFVEALDFEGVTVVPFCTSGGSGVGSSADNLASLAGAGNWLPGERFAASVSDAELEQWLNSMR